MTAQRPLNKFEESLLGELKAYALESSPSQTETSPPTRGPLKKWLAGVAAASALAIGGIAGVAALSPSAAFAIDIDAQGNTVVSVRALSNGDELQRALGERGIGATVDFDDRQGDKTIYVVDDDDVHVAAVFPSEGVEGDGSVSVTKRTGAGPDDDVTSGKEITDACTKEAAPVVTRVDDGWRIVIAEKSPLRHLPSKWLVDGKGRSSSSSNLRRTPGA